MPAVLQVWCGGYVGGGCIYAGLTLCDGELVPLAFTLGTVDFLAVHVPPIIKQLVWRNDIGYSVCINLYSARRVDYTIVVAKQDAGTKEVEA